MATINEKIERTARSLLPQLTKCHVFISHQVADGFKYTDEMSFISQHVAYSKLESRGLSKNRNNALSHMTQEINLIADDDVEYVPDFENVILKEYASHSEADVITFKVERGHLAQNVKGSRFNHTKWTLLKVPSIGITFRKASIEKSGIRFDERFGLGSTYETGEEALFLKDCLDAGLKLMHVDIPIVRHTHLSSGWIWDKKQVKAKVAIIWKLYGPFMALLVPLGFTFTKYSLYKEHMGVFTYVTNVLKSHFSILTKGL